MSRTAAREYALLMLYARDLNPDSETIDEEEVEAKMTDKDREFSESLCSFFASHKEEIDEVIISHLKKWSLSQINGVDRNILRLALAESLSAGTDRKIIINESVNLANKFGGEKSFRFINGLLDKVLKQDGPVSGD